MTIHENLRIRKVGKSAVLVIPLQILHRLKSSTCLVLGVVQMSEVFLLRPQRRGRRLKVGARSDSSALTRIQAKALDQRLKAFDPTRHGGEFMAIRTKGSEAL